MLLKIKASLLMSSTFLASGLYLVDGTRMRAQRLLCVLEMFWSDILDLKGMEWDA